jgi:GNAT superfamily N-acetyltransferase
MSHEEMRERLAVLDPAAVAAAVEAAQWPPEVFTWDTPDLLARDRTALASAEERAPDDVDVRVTRYWSANRDGYALVADLGDRDWLMELWVHPAVRRQGIGGQLLARVLADRAGRGLALEARPFELKEAIPGEPAPDAAQLAAWYERHGFRCDGDLPPDIYMVREPGS